MFSMGAATRIYVAVGATDMRKSFNGLEGLVRERLACDPTSGHIFLFANARCDRLKLIFFDGTGLWVCAKRAGGCAGRRASRARCNSTESNLRCLSGNPFVTGTAA